MATLLNTLLASVFSAFLSTPQPVSLPALTSYRAEQVVTVQVENSEMRSFRVYFRSQEELLYHL